MSRSPNILVFLTLFISINQLIYHLNIYKLKAQSLFKEAVNTTPTQSISASDRLSYELNGYIRADFFGTKPSVDNKVRTQTIFSETALKLNIKKGQKARAYSEFRLQKGSELNYEYSQFDIREAYIELTLDQLDLKLGRQIAIWGRADGFNPTDNFSPKNMLVRSADEDDKCVGNFLLRSWYHLDPINLEFIWVPVYQSSVIPTQNVAFPNNAYMSSPEYPNSDLENSSIGIKVNYQDAAWDCSLSFFHGYNLTPGINGRINGSSSDQTVISIFPEAYKVQVIGADFSTTIKNTFGLRGEMGYGMTHKNHKEQVFIPNPYLSYVLGVDKSLFINGSFLVQYIGKNNFEFEELNQPSDPNQTSDSNQMFSYMIQEKNRMFSWTQYQTTHALMTRIKWAFLYDTLMLEFMGMHNFTSSETMFKAKVAYDIIDDLTFTMGLDRYIGPADSIYRLLSDEYSTVYLELISYF